MFREMRTGPLAFRYASPRPGVAANLGPGFDALALALNRYVDVEVEPADVLTLRIEGEGEDLPVDANHPAARVARQVLGHDRVFITVRSQIPVGRGLGSSAALAVAVAAACGGSDPLALAGALDGHPENAAASVLGGLVAATEIAGTRFAVRLPLDPACRSWCWCRPAHFRRPGPPGAAGPGAAGRRRLQPRPHGRPHRRAGRPAAAAPPRLRRPPPPGGPGAPLPRIRPPPGRPGRGRGAGRLLVRAGPSLLGICASEAGPRVREAGEELLSRVGVPGHSLLLEADLEGLVVEDPALQA